MKYLFTILLSFTSIILFAQIYVEGDGTGKEIYVDGISGATYTFYVNGGINNNGGEIVNDAGEIELTGDWQNTPVGLITNSYESNGVERFSGSSTQNILGTMNGTVSNYNQFYNLKIDKASAGQYVNLQTDVNVNAAGTLQFELNGIIRTDNASHGNNGSLYPYELYIRNTSSTAITGYATTGTNNYIEGKLYRQVSGSATYYFPVGIQPTSLDGEEPFQVTTTSASSSSILGYVQPGSTSYIGYNIFCDVGTDPSPTTGTPVTANPGSPADGILDLLYIDCEYSVEWVATPSSSGYTYSITGIPGTVLQSECVFFTGMTVTYPDLRWFGKDGLPNNVSATSPAPFFTSGFETCPNIYTIAGLSSATSTSEYRVHGVVDGSTSVLPIEILSFSGEVTTAGNLLSWVTETEIDNVYFDLESAANYTSFSSIGIIDGAGSSSTRISYSFLDKEPKAQTTYYRLRTVNESGNFNYSNIVALTRNLFAGLQLYPVPALNTLSVDLNTDISASEASFRIISSNGVIVRTEYFDIVNGNNLFELTISDLAPALYFLEVNTGKEILREQFIKQ